MTTSGKSNRKEKYTYLAGYGEIGKKKRFSVENSLQLCRESWNGYECFAIREFLPDGNPGKGVALKPEQLLKLKELLNEIDL